ncbi:type IV secretory system conjugative DNA transfer family protein [Acidiferrimicrobium sp. IK]|uniref:type IV secretory system conjugative DNA transfer family protein n=1 Tax=Acidiferrimicrobium sp. IK TaxID=2871700 RepID=UPI0021CB3B2B|nr:type IV secretory system conjugative DNA transfer family protein [Acidiferrimicrobium sp. IK]MCU4186949.1 type IV secretory system conjugative DNA transfer family protein [Acidiferrimicrobium sp. IK]
MTGAGPRPRAASERRGDAWSLVALAAVLMVGAWVWVTGQVAGRLASGQWPPVPGTDVPGIVRRLPAVWPDIRAAWPPAARPRLPAAPVMAAIAVALAVGCVAAGAAVVAAWRRWRPGERRAEGRPFAVGRRAGGNGGARWARRGDLASLRVRGATPGRLVLGRSGRSLIATEARHSVLVLGPTQSGKTTGLAIPAILEWDGPVVATSVKDDLAATTRRWRAESGTAWVFDPTATSGLAGLAGWSPLAEAADWAGAQRMASWLVEAAPARSGMSDGAFWFAAAAKLLAPLMLAAAAAGATMADVVRWNDLGDYREPLDVLDDSGCTEAAVALEACAARDERLRSSVATTLETVLAPFADPVVAGATARTDIDVQRLVTGRDTLYLCGPSHEQFRVQGLFAGLVASVIAAAVDHVHRCGRPLDPPLLVVLDEAANIAPLRDLDTLASTAAGLGVQLVTVCQDLAQLATRYGQDRARTIANNHRAKLVLSGVSDLSTLDLVSGLAGEAAVREHSESADLRDGRRTRTSSTVYRRLASPDLLRQTPPGRGVLVYGHLPAIRLGLRPWYRDARLRRRAGVSSP